MYLEILWNFHTKILIINIFICFFLLTIGSINKQLRNRRKTKGEGTKQNQANILEFGGEKKNCRKARRQGPGKLIDIRKHHHLNAIQSACVHRFDPRVHSLSNKSTLQ